MDWILSHPILTGYLINIPLLCVFVYGIIVEPTDHGKGILMGVMLLLAIPYSTLGFATLGLLALIDRWHSET